jgi:hypothetical protein
VYRNSKVVTALAVLIISSLTIGTQAKVNKSSLKGATKKNAAILWREPEDIASRNMFYGPARATNPAGCLRSKRKT